MLNTLVGLMSGHGDRTNHTDPSLCSSSHPGRVSGMVRRCSVGQTVAIHTAPVNDSIGSKPAMIRSVAPGTVSGPAVKSAVCGDSALAGRPSPERDNGA